MISPGLGLTGARINLVRDLVGFVFPGTKRSQSFLAHDLNHRNLTLRMRLRDFAIDQRIVESDPGCICIGIGKIDPGKTGPVDCPQAHGTRLTGGIDLATFEVENAEFLARLTYGNHFRVRGRIICGSDLIRALCNNRAVFHNDRTEGSTAPGVDVVNREPNGAGHERIVHVFALFGQVECDAMRAIFSSTLCIAALAGALALPLVAAAPAHAQWHGGGGGGGRHGGGGGWHGGGGGWHGGGGWRPGCCWRGGIFLGPPIVYAPPPVYYAPPPVYY